MCELMKTIQIYTEKPQLWPIYILSGMPVPESDAQRRRWMFAERRTRRAENVQLNRYWRETRQLLFQIEAPGQGSRAAERL